MRMNPGIILSGQAPDIIGNMARGAQAAQFQNDAQHQNALRAMLQQNGAGIMAGEQNALAALAGFDPQAALGIQQTRQSMAESAERMQMARAQAARQAQAWAQGQSADAVARERQNLANGLRGAAYFYSQGDQEGYAQFLTQQGIDPAQFRFDQFPAHAAMVEGVLDALGQFSPQESVEVPAAVRTLQMRAEAAGLQPGSPEYQQFMLNGGGGRPQTVVNVGGEATGDPYFSRQLAERDATTFSTLEGQGVSARRGLMQLGQLESLLENTETGVGASMQMLAGRFGIPTDGLSELQAADALISQLVPQQRPPGSGTMSDADLALFRQSLPQIMNQPGANRLIMDTMRRMLEHDAQLGEIATAVNTGAITRSEARERMTRLADPLAGVRRAMPAASRTSQLAPPQPRVGPTPTGQPTQAQNVPDQAVRMLLDDPSPEAMREFDEVFGPGQAQRLLEAMR